MTKMKLANWGDLERVRTGDLRHEDVRSVEIEGVVDTGASSLVLPADVVGKLGLHIASTRIVTLADGRKSEVPYVGVVRLEILDRETFCGAVVMPAGTMPLIGQVPLEELDLIVDPKSQEVRVRLAEGPVWMLYAAAS